MKVFITGGTGLVGQALVAALRERRDTAVVLTRSRSRAEGLWPTGVEIVEGDPCYAGEWQKELAGCDAVINLAGESLAAKRWDARFRQLIHDSRVDSTRHVCEAIVACEEAAQPKVLANASGADYYGFAEVVSFDDDEIGENDPGGESFLAGLCWDWEEETKICSEAGVRVALMRTGLVLGRTGGALKKLAGPFRMGFGGRLGSGRQWMSWIHIDDVVGAYLHVIDGELRGPVNVVSPGNVRNSDFADVLGSVLGRKAWLPVPAKAVRAVAGQLSEYLLKGRRTMPHALVAADYRFAYPVLQPALTDLLAR